MASLFHFRLFLSPTPSLPPPWPLSPMLPVFSTCVSGFCASLLFSTYIKHLALTQTWFLSLLHKNQIKSYVPLCILFFCFSLHSDTLLKFFHSFSGLHTIPWLTTVYPIEWFCSRQCCSHRDMWWLHQWWCFWFWIDMSRLLSKWCSTVCFHQQSMK